MYMTTPYGSMPGTAARDVHEFVHDSRAHSAGVSDMGTCYRYKTACIVVTNCGCRSVPAGSST